jgi:murein L,D-transpeptidase YafK
MRMLVRWLFAFGLLLPLAGCLATIEKAQAPLPETTRAELAAMGVALGAPVYVRIFKSEAQLEVWMGKADGTYQLVRTYDICNWSGGLGPKVREGDKQAPEGYYIVTARQMNPNSEYYLSFNIGFPNAYDRAYGRTGSALMVHGGCLSKGCYAITDEAIQELYTFAREAFAQGQREFPLHAYPFRLTTESLKLYKRDRWYSFWANLKEGYDMFERTRVPPVAGLKNKRYVFFKNASSAKVGGLITGW